MAFHVWFSDHAQGQKRLGTCDAENMQEIKVSLLFTAEWPRRRRIIKKGSARGQAMTSPLLSWLTSDFHQKAFSNILENDVCNETLVFNAAHVKYNTFFCVFSGDPWHFISMILRTTLCIKVDTLLVQKSSVNN